MTHQKTERVFRRHFGGKLTGALGAVLGLSMPFLAQADPPHPNTDFRQRLGSPPASRLLVLVDRDDDDDDGRPDLEARTLSDSTLPNLTRVAAGILAPGGRAPDAEAPFRLVRPNGIPVAAGTRIPAGPIAIQGLRPGLGALRSTEGLVPVAVVEFRAFDGQGRVIDPATSHASLSRILPTELGEPAPDRDAIRWLSMGPAADLPRSVTVSSTSPTGDLLDTLGPVAMDPVTCPAGTPPELACRQSAPIRASTDPVDRGHPAVAHRSVLAEVGGRLTLQAEGLVASSLRVGGPRSVTGGNGPGRYRARVRAHVLRTAPGGTPAVGSDDAEAKDLIRREIQTASSLWGQCGIHFGKPDDVVVEVVEPPPTYLVAVGCDTGLPASGGTIRLRASGQDVQLKTRPGELPLSVASRLAERFRQKGFSATVYPNAHTARGAERTADLVVRSNSGELIEVEAGPAPMVSDDPTLNVCLGRVTVGDGILHFTDYDAAAGTIEERALIRAFEDDDPSTIELFVVPVFGGTGRIGESFIFGPGGSIQNAVIIDRAGVRAGARSFTLAHELGHILLDMPGHPDDFGVDMPSALMDADAADSTIFGPRRLSIEECERALRQNGPRAPVPLLEPWPLYQSRVP